MNLEPPNPMVELEKITKSLQFLMNPLETLITTSNKEQIAETTKEVKKSMRQLLALINMLGSAVKKEQDTQNTVRISFATVTTPNSNSTNSSNIAKNDSDLSKLQQTVLEMNNKLKMLFEMAEKLQGQLNPDLSEVKTMCQTINADLGVVLTSAAGILQKTAAALLQSQTQPQQQKQ